MAAAQNVVGTIWRWDHADVLTEAEARHWDVNALPMGWAIIRDAKP